MVKSTRKIGFFKNISNSKKLWSRMGGFVTKTYLRIELMTML